ncbi:MAG: 4Fe-4S binding protein [Holophagaceae bacterium]|nr:4Fe-4S binding protein [Holophagaceae bacterium]
MNTQNPIFTEMAKCRDCYKCVRKCPVKAIQVVNDHAAIIPGRCVYCGNCVSACPVGAKKLRDDVSRVKLMLRQKEKVIVSLAPSFISEFKGIAPSKLIHAIKKLGFWAVSETALGAQEISKACVNEMEKSDTKLHISTACPTIVELVKRYHPEFISYLTPLTSPVIAHCKMLRKEFGEDIGIVLISPCIAKKLESDSSPNLLDVALTFDDLRSWFEEHGIDPEKESAKKTDVFVPVSSHDGALYPIDGGMAESIDYYSQNKETKYMAFSGIQFSRAALQGLENLELKNNLFIELLACKGGCINGPKSVQKDGTIFKRLCIADYAREPEATEVTTPDLVFSTTTNPDPVPIIEYDDSEIATALLRIGKSSVADEINCGGCGYDSCRKLAEALLEDRAEPSMCVSYMRNLAMNKANALIRSMPAGVALVDEHLSIIECNRKFAEIIGGDTLDIYDISPGMSGASLQKIAPELSNSFARGLEKEVHDMRKDVRIGNKLLRLTIFSIELDHIVGGVLQDITEPAVQREQIIQKAQEVIHKNVTTVQQIAFLLGENAAETEIMLDSLTSSFRMEPSNMGDSLMNEDSPNAH